MSPLSLLFLLLPVAALSGWFVGRRSRRKSRRGRNRAGEECPVPQEYFEGLSYLLEDETDKAIDVFIRMLEVDSETVEIHTALGNLFRRRGEVDRAIRVHQNLIARPTLTREQRSAALFELGQDYMRAGLFDRAESLFLELTDSDEHGEAARRHLVSIYEQEKDWQKAIDVARRLVQDGDRTLGRVVAQYYCEEAEQCRSGGRVKEAERLLRQALVNDRDCVRASIVEGRMAMDAGAWKAAAKAFRRVPEQDPEFLPEVLPDLRQCYERLRRPLELIHYLKDVVAEHGGSATLLALAELVARQQGDQQAALFLRQHLEDNPSLAGLERYIELTQAHSNDQERRDLEPVREILERILLDRPLYLCHHCGFRGKVLHWQCPSCKYWGTVKPASGP